MQMISTRDAATSVSLSEALLQGMAADGGLYVPRQFPFWTPHDFDSLDTLSEVSSKLLQPFFTGDPLEAELTAICAQALDVPAPVIDSKDPEIKVLELFHGPSGAFKDFGARFLAACMERLHPAGTETRTILVATSGDTGSAVAAAFHRRAGFRVVILFPADGVSPRQAHLLSCFGDNVLSLKVDGNFDDCQALVKQAFADRALRERLSISSANSISMGRLLPQMSYYALAALSHWRAHGSAAQFVIPTGNLGNALACIWTRACGLPIAAIRMASNANRPVADYFGSGERRPRPSIATLANAMDVGDPSNLERLMVLPAALREDLQALSVDDASIRAVVAAGPKRYAQIWCPHTATAVHYAERLLASGQHGPWIVAATAHPAKFETVVEPLIGQTVPLPPALQSWLQHPTQTETLRSDYAQFRERLHSAAR